MPVSKLLYYSVTLSFQDKKTVYLLCGETELGLFLERIPSMEEFQESKQVDVKIKLTKAYIMPDPEPTISNSP